MTVRNLSPGQRICSESPARPIVAPIDTTNSIASASRPTLDVLMSNFALADNVDQASKKSTTQQVRRGSFLDDALSICIASIRFGRGLLLNMRSRGNRGQRRHTQSRFGKKVSSEPSEIGISGELSDITAKSNSS